MNTLKNISFKPTLILIGTLGLGFLLGFLTQSYFAQQKMLEILSLKTEKGFTSKYLDIIDPDETQKEEIENLLQEYALKNSQLVADFTDSLNRLKSELKEKLDPKLNSQQRQKIQKSLSTNQTTIPTPTFKKREIIKEIIKDSASAALVDSLKVRRKALRKEKVLEKIESKIDERSLVLKKELNLDEKQFVAVDKLNKDFTYNFIALKADSTISPEIKKIKIREMSMELTQKMKLLLSPTQFEKYKAMRKEMIKSRK